MSLDNRLTQIARPSASRAEQVLASERIIAGFKETQAFSFLDHLYAVIKKGGLERILRNGSRDGLDSAG